VVDFAGFTADDAARVVRVLAGRTCHFVVISNGQVYLVREGCPVPSREVDYDGSVMSCAPSPAERDDWLYGIGKRGAEDVLAPRELALLRSTRISSLGVPRNSCATGLPLIREAGEGEDQRRQLVHSSGGGVVGKYTHVKL
jgi:hypothetical protein